MPPISFALATPLAAKPALNNGLTDRRNRHFLSAVMVKGKFVRAIQRRVKMRAKAQSRQGLSLPWLRRSISPTRSATTCPIRVRVLDTGVVLEAAEVASRRRI